MTPIGRSRPKKFLCASQSYFTYSVRAFTSFGNLKQLQLKQSRRSHELEFGRLLHPNYAACRSFSTFASLLRKCNPFAEDLVTGELRNIKDDYEIKEKLGYGRYGEVFVGQLKADESVRHAVKTIPKSKVRFMEDLKQEIDMLERLNHQHIINIVGIYEDVHSVHIVTNLCAGGELFDHIVKKGTVSETDASRFVRQMLEALSYCHEKNIVHRDIKPENVLFKTKEDESSLCLVDFGMSRIFKDDELMNVVVGSPAYVAPEVLDLKYGEKCDVWSVGVILYLLLSGEIPFGGKTDEEILTAVAKAKLEFPERNWSGVSPEAIDLVKKLMEVDPSKRLSATEALNHKWIRNPVANRKSHLRAAISNMRIFTTHKKLKRVALGYVAGHLVKTQENEALKLQSMFHRLDTDNDGLLSLDQVVSVIQNNTDKDVIVQPESLFKHIDVDASGHLNIDEFVAAAMHQATHLKESYINHAFQKFDTNGKGYITRQQLVKALGNSADIEQIMNEADTNKDGVIDYREFTHVMREQSFQTKRSLSKHRTDFRR